MSETVRVWAPEASRVEVKVGSESIPAVAEGDGYWSAEVDADLARTPYAFILDGGPPLPDPRSERQLDGVHGPSLRVRHEAYSWSDAGFQQVPLSTAVIYELHVGTFTPEGTLDAAIKKLEYLSSLGITHVELMPLATASGKRGWGYDGVDLWAPHEAYGGPEAVKRFVDAAHRMGLATIIDVVYNHLGPEGNYLHEFGPYFTDRYKTPWGEAVNLDGPGSNEVRRFFIENALMWLRDYHFDALRVDAVHAFYDKSALNFLEELQDAVRDLERSLGRGLAVIAESDLNDPRLVRSREAGGYGLAAQWSDDFHHAVHCVVTGERWGYYADYGKLAQVARALERTFVFDGGHQSSRGRRHGRPAADLPPDRFLAYIQNHDQVGNRAGGERISHIAGEKLQKVAAAVYLLSPFVPMIFQGEEWAASSPFLYFTDHQDPELGAAVREGRQREFSFQSEHVPDPQAPETAKASVLDWDERSREPHADVQRWYRKLLELRRSVADLAGGSRRNMVVTVDEEAQTLVMRRGRIAVLCNFSRQSRAVGTGLGRRQAVLADSENAERSGSVETRPDGLVELPAASALVVASE